MLVVGCLLVSHAVAFLLGHWFCFMDCGEMVDRGIDPFGYRRRK